MAVLQYGSLIERVAVTTTSGTTTTLINTSPTIQEFTGSTTQTVVLPVATTFTPPGLTFEIYNKSTSSILLQFQDTTTFQSIPANSAFIVKCTDNTPSNGSWVSLA